MSLINSGGMGDVFLAEDTQLKRSVAVKLLRDVNANNEHKHTTIERAIEEGRMLAKLSHPNIVQVFDMVRCENHTGIVMEYIKGPNLAELLKHDLSFDEKLLILKQVADAIAAAHKQDIIHCDIKPANIIVGDKNQVKMTDFGIAHLSSRMQEKADTTNVYGSPVFMAPELWKGSSPSKASDWFSFGILAFELLGGFHPYSFGATSHQQISENIQNKASESARNILPSLPMTLVELLNQLIAKMPSDRPNDSDYIANRMNQIAQSFALEKQSAFVTQTMPITRIRKLKQHHMWLIATSLVLFAFSLLFVFPKNKNVSYYVAVLKPVIQISDERQSNEQSILLAAIDDTLRRSVMQASSLKLIAYSETKEATHDLSNLGRETNADAIILTSIDCITTSCDIIFSLATQSVRNEQVIWEVVKREKWTSMFENYTDVTQVAESQLHTLLSNVIKSNEKIVPIRESFYRQYLTIYQAVVFNGAYSEVLLENSEALIQQQPSFIPGYHLLMDIAEKLFVEQMDDNLLKRLETSLALMPEEHLPNVGFLTHLFHLYLNTGQLNKAKSQLVELAELSIHDADYKPLEASYLLATNRYEAAINAYNEAIKLRPSKVLYHNLAIAYWWHNDINEARKLLQKILTLSPNDYETLQLLATLHLSQGNTAQAITTYKKLMSLNPSSMEMSNLALAYMLEGDYKKSYVYAKQAVDKSPQNPIWMLNLADVQKLTNNLPQATQLYQQVIDIYRGNTDLYAWLGIAQAQAHQGNYSDAIRAIDNARKVSPNNAEVAYISSIVLTLAGEHLSAINQANEALNNGIGHVWYNLPWFNKLCSHQQFQDLFSQYQDFQRC
jgi:serine/threonine-protein kinase